MTFDTAPPAGLATRLQQGIDELGMASHPITVARLLQFVELIRKWNRVYNLTAITDPAQMVTSHVLDSLALQRFLPTGAMLDVGSGAGLPGLPLAIANPALLVTSVDAVDKKIVFQRQVTAELALTNVEVIHGRVEALGAHLQPFMTIVARAFASLADFTNLTRALLAPGGRWYAMKGAVPEQELAALPESVQLVAIHPLDVPGLGAARHLIVLEKST